MNLRNVLVRLDEALGHEGRSSLRPAATAKQIAATAAALEMPLPPTLRDLYEWHDGETPSSTLFHDALEAEVAVTWGAFSDAPYTISFMSLDDVARAGVTNLYMTDDGDVVRSAVEAGDAEQVGVVPFVWIRRRSNVGGEPGEDDDWFYAVDTRRGAVWLFEVGNENLEGALEEAPNLGKLLEKVAAHARRVAAAKPKAAPVVEAPSVLCFKFLLDRKLVELAEGISPAQAAERIAPLLAARPPKRAVRAVLEHLSEDDSIAEVFADDDVLARVVSEFLE
ncbi:MAG: hypothetical protein J0I07_28400 [Myxococcales bacterium]|nr:hypothetical protein [Myxococcales bacterium]